MPKVKNGYRVRVHYTGKFDDGTVFDSSRDAKPLQFSVGSGEVIPGFDAAVAGMAVGESKTVRIKSSDAYGPHREDMVVSIEKGRLPPEIKPVVGQRLQIDQDGGLKIQAVITGVTDSAVVLDANHPLAGKDLIFDIELVEIAK